VRPVSTLLELDCIGIRICPSYFLVEMINYSTCPEVSLGILSNESVELILPRGGVQGDRLHVHQLAVLLGIGLLEGRTTKLPGHNIPWIVAGVIWFPRARAACYCVRRHLGLSWRLGT